MPLRPGSSMILLALYHGPRDATQVHQNIFGPIRPQQPIEHLKSKLLDLLQLNKDATQERQCLGELAQCRAHGQLNARQCTANSPNGAVVGQRNDLVDVESQVSATAMPHQSGNDLRAY
ncbi:hypothetical protein EV121DRAFT_285878 [Schizophyllum commune]